MGGERRRSRVGGTRSRPGSRSMKRRGVGGGEEEGEGGGGEQIGENVKEFRYLRARLKELNRKMESLEAAILQTKRFIFFIFYF